MSSPYTPPRARIDAGEPNPPNQDPAASSPTRRLAIGLNLLLAAASFAVTAWLLQGSMWDAFELDEALGALFGLGGVFSAVTLARRRATAPLRLLAMTVCTLLLAASIGVVLLLGISLDLPRFAAAPSLLLLVGACAVLLVAGPALALVAHARAGRLAGPRSGG